MIAQARRDYPGRAIAELCRMLGVSRSWLYERPTVPTQAERDLDLRDAIERMVLEFPVYGYRRVTEALGRDGWAVNHKRVLRVMRQESLLCQLQRRFAVTTDSRHDHVVYPNLLAEATLSGLNQAWQADITYVRLPTAFVYLAAILDSFSRRVVGWALSRDIDTRLTLAALEMALDRRSPPAGFIHHSDRGVQYASADYVARLTAAGARISMSAKGNPYDNAKAESFFKTLKREEVQINSYVTFAEAEANLGRFIEEVYNLKRLHSSLGYVAPAEFEARFTSTEPKLTLTTVR
jgi:transposase InsO family protein